MSLQGANDDGSLVTYGALKSLALVNWGHGYHYFVGLVRETLVMTFSVMAYNFHIQRTFAVRRALETKSEPEETPLGRPHADLP